MPYRNGALCRASLRDAVSTSREIQHGISQRCPTGERSCRASLRDAVSTPREIQHGISQRCPTGERSCRASLRDAVPTPREIQHDISRRCPTGTALFVGHLCEMPSLRRGKFNMASHRDALQESQAGHLTEMSRKDGVLLSEIPSTINAWSAFRDRRMAHPPRIPVLLDDASPVVYFVTICVDGRAQVLADHAAWSALCKAAAQLHEWKTLAMLAMPDHVHLLIAPLDRSASPGNYSKWFKRSVRTELGATWRWQAGCFDHLLRNDESAQQKWTYVRENPVQAGLVSHWRQWPFQTGFQDP